MRLSEPTGTTAEPASLTRRQIRALRQEGTEVLAPEPSNPDAPLRIDPGFAATCEEPVAPIATPPRRAPRTTPVWTPSSRPAATTPPRRSTLRRRAAAFTATVCIMGLTGLIVVGMTTPPQAAVVAMGGASLAEPAPETDRPSLDKDDIQVFVASGDLENAALHRGGEFTTISRADLAAEQGIRYSDSLYTNDPTATIQWPYVVGVAMSSPYGPREGSMHQGIDLVPGDGAPIQSIADGTVRLATESNGAYGVSVYVDHKIDGNTVTSHYAHMQYGSLRVVTGQQVKVGDILGLTGNTGRSFGAHLHFEIMVNGEIVDPLPWLQEHAGRKDPIG